MRRWIVAFVVVAVVVVVADVVSVVLALTSVVSDGLPSNVMVGHLRPYPWWVLLIEWIFGLSVVAAVVYLIRRH